MGSFVNSICNNVLLEHYRAATRNTSLDEEEEKNFPAITVDLLGALSARETEKKVREILEKISERDRRLLREVFLEERDKDQVCGSSASIGNICACSYTVLNRHLSHRI